jgi:hypothetical protein
MARSRNSSVAAIGRQRGSGELLAEGDAGLEEPTTRRTVRRSN